MSGNLECLTRARPKDAVWWGGRTHTTVGCQYSTDPGITTTPGTPPTMPAVHMASGPVSAGLRVLTAVHQASSEYSGNPKIPDCSKPPFLLTKMDLVKTVIFDKKAYLNVIVFNEKSIFDVFAEKWPILDISLDTTGLWWFSLF